MKNLMHILFLAIFSLSWSQDEFHNFGNIQIHDEGQIGFHINQTEKILSFIGVFTQDQSTHFFAT